MTTIIQNNIVKWNVSNEPILFITSSYTASGKTTLTKKLVSIESVESKRDKLIINLAALLQLKTIYEDEDGDDDE